MVSVFEMLESIGMRTHQVIQRAGLKGTDGVTLKYSGGAMLCVVRETHLRNLLKCRSQGPNLGI